MWPHRPKESVQPTKHAPHARMLEPRRSQSVNCPLHSAALCAALSVSCSLFTVLYKKNNQSRRGDRARSIQRTECATPDAWG